VVVSTGGEKEGEGKDDDHAVSSQPRASTLADDHGQADGGDDHEGEHQCDGGAHKGDDDREHPRGSTMMCPGDGGARPPPPPSMPPPPPSGGGSGAGGGSVIP